MQGRTSDSWLTLRKIKIKSLQLQGQSGYGGGGIIPNVLYLLIPRVSDFLVKVNDKSLQMQYSALLADKCRTQLCDKTLPQLEGLLSKWILTRRIFSIYKRRAVVPNLENGQRQRHLGRHR